MEIPPIIKFGGEPISYDEGTTKDHTSSLLGYWRRQGPTLRLHLKECQSGSQLVHLSEDVLSLHVLRSFISDLR